MSTNQDLTISAGDIAVPKSAYNIMTDDGTVALAYAQCMAVVRATDAGLMVGFIMYNFNSGTQNINLKAGDIYYTFSRQGVNYLKLVNEAGYVTGAIGLNLLSNTTDFNEFNSISSPKGWNAFPWLPVIQ